MSYGKEEFVQTLVGLGDVHLKHCPSQIAHEVVFSPAIAGNFRFASLHLLSIVFL